MQRVAELFQNPLRVVNIGVERFYDAMRLQETEAVHVQWRPAAGGDQRLQAILKQLDNI